MKKPEHKETIMNGHYETDQDNRKVLVFISAENSSDTVQTNRAMTERLKDNLMQMGLEFQEMIGVYKGLLERSFMVIPKRDLEIDGLKAIARTYEQESILIVSRDRRARLCYVATDTSEYLPGEFKRVYTSQGLDSYTIDPETAAIYAIKE